MGSPRTSPTCPATGLRLPSQSGSRWSRSRPSKHVAARIAGRPAYEQLRALYTSPWFWQLAALLPNNDLAAPRSGRPRGYPDWFMLLVTFASGIIGVASARSAVTMLSDQVLWAHFVDDVDRYVPPGWTCLSEIEHSEARHRASARPRVRPGATRAPQAVPLPSRRRPRRSRRPDASPLGYTTSPTSCSSSGGARRWTADGFPVSRVIRGTVFERRCSPSFVCSGSTKRRRWGPGSHLTVSVQGPR